LNQKKTLIGRVHSEWSALLEIISGNGNCSKLNPASQFRQPNDLYFSSGFDNDCHVWNGFRTNQSQPVSLQHQTS
jgi:hypothetical protein